MSTVKKYQSLKIYGVSGFGHWPVFERIKGQMDAKHGQVREVESGYATPWILRKAHYTESYMNTAYLIAADKLEQPHKDAYMAIEELKHLRKAEFPEKHSSVAEHDKRLAAKRLSAMNGSKSKIDSLCLRLAEIEAMIEEYDTDLAHTIERAEAVLDSHVSQYWEGVLRGTELTELPICPVVWLKEPKGCGEYRSKKDSIIEMIHEALKPEEV